MPCATKHAFSQRFARTEDETRDLATLEISSTRLKIENFLEFWNQPLLKILKTKVKARMFPSDISRSRWGCRKSLHQVTVVYDNFRFVLLQNLPQ